MWPRTGARGPPSRSSRSQLPEGAKEALLFFAAALPAAAGRDRHRGQRTPPPGQLEGEPAAERVAGDVHAVEACRVELGLGHVHRSGDAMLESAGNGLAAHVSGEGRGEHLVPLLERRKDRSPGFGAEREGMQEKERLPRAAVVSDGPSQHHSGNFRAMDIIPTIEAGRGSGQRRVEGSRAPRDGGTDSGRCRRTSSVHRLAPRVGTARRRPALRSAAMLFAPALVLALAQAPLPGWTNGRPPECATPMAGATVNVWERAKSPELRRYCDLVASAASKLAGTAAMAQAALAAAREAEGVLPGHAAPRVLEGRALAALGKPRRGAGGSPGRQGP